MAVKHQFKGGEVPEGDIRGHIFRTNLDPEWNMFTDDGKFVRVDDQQKAYMTVEYTCLSCHKDKDKAWAIDAGKKVHGGWADIRSEAAGCPTGQPFVVSGWAER
jgi:hypothetical protein